MSVEPGAILLGPDGRRLLHPDGRLMIHDPGADLCCRVVAEPCPFCDQTPPCVLVRLTGWNAPQCRPSFTLGCCQPITFTPRNIDGAYVVRQMPGDPCRYQWIAPNPSAYRARLDLHEPNIGGSVDCDRPITETTTINATDFSILVEFGATGVHVAVICDFEYYDSGSLIPILNSSGHASLPFTSCVDPIHIDANNTDVITERCINNNDPDCATVNVPPPMQIDIAPSMDCQPPDYEEPPVHELDRGVCCFPDRPCKPDMYREKCERRGGTWLGPNAECWWCPPYAGAGACCEDATGDCEITLPEDCGPGHTFHGVGVPCLPLPCDPPPGEGACCVDHPDGDYCLLTTEQECGALGGFFRGLATKCTPNVCSQPLQPCCLGPAHCIYTTALDCFQQGGTDPLVADCADADCGGDKCCTWSAPYQRPSGEWVQRRICFEMGPNDICEGRIVPDCTDCPDEEAPVQPPHIGVSNPPPSTAPASSGGDFSTGCCGDAKNAAPISARAILTGAYTMAARRLGKIKTSSPELQAQRLATCEACEQYGRVRPGYCGKPLSPLRSQWCGCYIAEKIKAANQRCPQGRW